MTSAPQPDPGEPAPPQRGLTREERGHQKKHHPEEYAANRAKYAKKK
ncbi:hypothetical protein TUM20985_11010 [Mycobacterium antarcticum]|nr:MULTISPECIES: hypothetical protein [unclassified Mycolicibacterium]BDX30554.1 hypothetical protein TUM20985_11010 [Mycolicibacterium sp. TUM20985]GLP79678.1 hypothetical protein TUM20984_10980 [Mycolicibacterium sp. TUM20984]